MNLRHRPTSRMPSTPDPQAAVEAPATPADPSPCLEVICVEPLVDSPEEDEDEDLKLATHETHVLQMAIRDNQELQMALQQAAQLQEAASISANINMNQVSSVVEQNNDLQSTLEYQSQIISQLRSTLNKPGKVDVVEITYKPNVFDGFRRAIAGLVIVLTSTIAYIASLAFTIMDNKMANAYMKPRVVEKLSLLLSDLQRESWKNHIHNPEGLEFAITRLNSIEGILWSPTPEMIEAAKTVETDLCPTGMITCLPEEKLERELPFVHLPFPLVSIAPLAEAYLYKTELLLAEDRTDPEAMPAVKELMRRWSAGGPAPDASPAARGTRTALKDTPSALEGTILDLSVWGSRNGLFDKDDKNYYFRELEERRKES